MTISRFLDPSSRQWSLSLASLEFFDRRPLPRDSGSVRRGLLVSNMSPASFASIRCRRRAIAVPAMTGAGNCGSTSVPPRPLLAWLAGRSGLVVLRCQKLVVASAAAACGGEQRRAARGCWLLPPVTSINLPTFWCKSRGLSSETAALSGDSSSFPPR